MARNWSNWSSGFNAEVGDIYYQIDDEELQALLEGPEIMGLWHNTLDLMRDKANEISQTEGAEYGSAVHSYDPPSGQPDKYDEGGYIYTRNFKARVDDYYHHTLAEVAAMIPELMEQAMQLEGGRRFDPSGRGSQVRGADGRFAPSEGVKSGKQQFLKNRGKKS